jgi:hypothetical protein
MLLDGTSKRISALSGVLGAEMLEVTITHFSGGSQAEQPIKVE